LGFFFHRGCNSHHSLKFAITACLLAQFVPRFTSAFLQKEIFCDASVMSGTKIIAYTDGANERVIVLFLITGSGSKASGVGD